MATGKDRPISLEFLAKVTDYLRNVEKVEVQTEQVETALVAVSNSSEDLERKLSKAMRDAAKDVEVLEKAVRDVPKATDDMADEAARDFGRIGDEARDAGSEAASEFKQNLGQGLASGGSPAEIITETLGGLVGSLQGPLGIAAAAIAGIGLVAFNRMKEEAEKVQAVMDSLAGSLQSQYEQGVRNISKLQELEGFNDWLKDNQETTAEWKDELEDAGIEMDKFLVSMYKGGDSAEDMEATLRQIVAQNTIWVGQGDRRHKQVVDEGKAAEHLLGLLQDSSAEHSTTAGYMQDQAAASQELARQLGLVDTTGDNIITEADSIAGSLGLGADAAKRLAQELGKVPSVVKVAFEADYSKMSAADIANMRARGILGPGSSVHTSKQRAGG